MGSVRLTEVENKATRLMVRVSAAADLRLGLGKLSAIFTTLIKLLFTSVFTTPSIARICIGFLVSLSDKQLQYWEK